MFTKSYKAIIIRKPTLHCHIMQGSYFVKIVIRWNVSDNRYIIPRMIVCSNLGTRFLKIVNIGILKKYSSKYDRQMKKREKKNHSA